MRVRVWTDMRVLHIVRTTTTTTTAETVHVSVFGGFWLLFHTYPCQGGRRILRDRLTDFLRAPCFRQSLVRSLCRVRGTGNSGYTGRRLQECSVLLVCFVPDSHLFGAVCCREVPENADFWENIPGYFRIQRLMARQWIRLWRQSTFLWCFTHFLREGELVS